jgi:hypothetical protein
VALLLVVAVVRRHRLAAQAMTGLVVGRDARRRRRGRSDSAPRRSRVCFSRTHRMPARTMAAWLKGEKRPCPAT